MTDEQRAQLGRLMAVEERVLSQLPALDFVTLRSTTNARESGVDLRGPDTSAAEAHLGRLRDRVRSHVGRIAAALPKAGIERAIAAMLDVVRHALDELGRAIELISTALYPRVSNPTVGLGDAIERAAASRSQPVTIEGARDEHVQQVRGLVRFLGELVGSVGGSAYVHVARDGLWVHATIAPLSTSAVDEDTDARISTYARDQLLRLAAYLLRVGAERDEGAWRVTFVAQSKQ